MLFFILRSRLWQLFKKKSLVIRYRNELQGFWKIYICTLHYLFFCLWKNIPHFFYRNYLFRCTESKCIVQCICEFCSGVNGLITFTLVLYEIHFLKGRKYLVYGIFIIKFLFKIPVYNKRNKTGYEMG